MPDDGKKALPVGIEFFRDFKSKDYYYVDKTAFIAELLRTKGAVSRQQMSVRPEELTERFIRGDSSRSTEGSGLGLSIAKSLVQVHGGSFEILMDGDLFKVLLAFPEYSESPADDTGAR